MARALNALLDAFRRLTPGRWAAIVALGAALTAVALLPSRSRTREPMFSPRTAEERRSYRLSRIESRARLRARLSSMRNLGVARAGEPGSIVVVHDSTIPAATRLLLDTITHRHTARYGAASPDARTVVVFTSDSALGAGRYTLLPEITDGRTCISVVLLRSGAAGRADHVAASRSAQRLLGGMLGPCAFVRAFGPPGAAARQILAENPVFALDPDWWRRRSRTTRIETTGDTIRARSFLTDGQWHWQWTVAERACSAGRLDSCRAALRDTVERLQHASPARGVISNHQTAWSRWGSTDVLASMVRDYGGDAFARFWRADGIPEEAFRAATGRPIEEFAMRFWRSTIGIDYPGPGIPRGSALLAIITAFGFVGVAVALAPRRVAR